LRAIDPALTDPKNVSHLFTSGSVGIGGTFVTVQQQYRTAVRKKISGHAATVPDQCRAFAQDVLDAQWRRADPYAL